MSFIPSGVYVVEHKTTAEDCRPGSTYWKRLVLDAQCSNYDDGARALGYADELRGIVYDVVRKPTLRPLKATPEDQRKYTQPSSKACPECKRKKGATPPPHTDEDGRVCADGRIVTDPGGRLYANQREHDETPEEFFERLIDDIAADPEGYYQRGEVVRLDDERAAHDADVWAVADEVRQSQLTGRWPRNPDACNQHGSFCAYWPVCTGEASIDDPTFYRDSSEHEELAAVSGTWTSADGAKRKLPLLTTSSLKAYRSCKRRYFYAYELRRRTTRESDVLRFGTLIHKGLEVWWRTCDLDQALAAMAGEADPFERAKAEALMMGYHARWLAEPFEVIAVETEFTSLLVNPDTGRTSRTWARGGKIDALARVA